MEETRSPSDGSRTFVTWAVVVRTELEAIPEIKQTLEQLGVRILFQKIASPSQLLWIQEKQREARP